MMNYNKVIQDKVLNICQETTYGGNISNDFLDQFNNSMTDKISHEAFSIHVLVNDRTMSSIIDVIHDYFNNLIHDKRTRLFKIRVSMPVIKSIYDELGDI